MPRVLPTNLYEISVPYKLTFTGLYANGVGLEFEQLTHAPLSQYGKAWPNSPASSVLGWTTSPATATRQVATGSQ